MSLVSRITDAIQNVDIKHVEQKPSNVLETDVYDATIVNAFYTETKEKAIMLNLEFKVDNKTFTENFCIVSKKGKNTYTSKDGTETPLISYVIVDAICLVTAGKPLAKLQDTVKQKMLSVYNKEAEKYEVLTGILNKQLKLGVQLVVENGFKDPTKTFKINRVNLVCNSKGYTVFELRKLIADRKAGLSPKAPIAIKIWLENNQGKVFDKTKKSSKSATSEVAAKTALDDDELEDLLN